MFVRAPAPLGLSIRNRPRSAHSPRSPSASPGSLCRRGPSGHPGRIPAEPGCRSGGEVSVTHRAGALGPEGGKTVARNKPQRGRISPDVHLRTVLPSSPATAGGGSSCAGQRPSEPNDAVMRPALPDAARSHGGGGEHARCWSSGTQQPGDADRPTAGKIQRLTLHRRDFELRLGRARPHHGVVPARLGR